MLVYGVLDFGKWHDIKFDIRYIRAQSGRKVNNLLQGKLACIREAVVMHAGNI